MKRIIRLTESDLTRIVKQVIQEQSEHVKNLYKSWANKRSGNPEEALKLMDDVFKYQKKLSSFFDYYFIFISEKSYCEFKIIKY